MDSPRCPCPPPRAGLPERERGEGKKNCCQLTLMTTATSYIAELAYPQDDMEVRERTREVMQHSQRFKEGTIVPILDFLGVYKAQSDDFRSANYNDFTHKGDCPICGGDKPRGWELCEVCNAEAGR